MHYVVALLDTPSHELNISRKEHGDVLTAAATNPDLVGGSRTTGRKPWSVQGDANSPFEEYGKMWELCLDKWIDEPRVPYFFIKYIQTTPQIKLSAYTSLLKKRENSNHRMLREEVVRSCDPLDDNSILKVAWGDPDEACRQIAKERVGVFTNYVGVQETRSQLKV